MGRSKGYFKQRTKELLSMLFDLQFRFTLALFHHGGNAIARRAGEKAGGALVAWGRENQTVHLRLSHQEVPFAYLCWKRTPSGD